MMKRWIDPLFGVELISMYGPEMVAFEVGVQMRTPGSAGALQSAKADREKPNSRVTSAPTRRFMGPYGLRNLRARALPISAFRMPALFRVAAGLGGIANSRARTEIGSWMRMIRVFVPTLGESNRK